MAKELSVNKNTKEFYDFYKSKLIEPKKLKNKNILIIELGNIKYIEEVKKYAKNVCVIDSTYNCFFGEIFENINTLENQIKSFLEKYKMPKFDLAIMNPPYGNPKSGIPAFIHNQIYNLCSANTNTISIMPCNKLETIHELSEEVQNTKQFTKKFELVTAEEANEKMNISTPNNLGIFVSFGEENVNWEKIKYKGNLKAKKILSKMNTECSIKDYCKNQKVTKHYCKISENHGHTGKEDELELVTPDFEKYVYNGSAGTQSFNVYLPSKNECKNFHASLLSKCMKFIRKFERDGIHIYFNSFPFMNDYSKPWNDKRFCYYFGITGYIDDDHAVKGSEWETILKAIK